MHTVHFTITEIKKLKSANKTLQICELQKSAQKEKMVKYKKILRLGDLFQNVKKITWDFPSRTLCHKIKLTNYA